LPGWSTNATSTDSDDWLLQVVAGVKLLYGDDNVVVELVTLPRGALKPLSRHSRSLLAENKVTD